MPILYFSFLNKDLVLNEDLVPNEDLVLNECCNLRSAWVWGATGLLMIYLTSKAVCGRQYGTCQSCTS